MPKRKASTGVTSAEELLEGVAAAEHAATHPAEPDVAGLPEQPTRFPDYLMPYAGRQERHYERFDELREEMLVGYGYNTARAYWGDLDDLYIWASEREKDVLALSDKEITQYLSLLRRRKYSENTIRRKRHTIDRFRRIDHS